MNEHKVKELETIFNYFCLSTVGINPNAKAKSIMEVMTERNYAMGRNKDGDILYFGKQEPDNEEPTIFASIDIGALLDEQLEYSKPQQWANELNNKSLSQILNNNIDHETLANDNCVILYADPIEESLFLEGAINGNKVYDKLEVNCSDYFCGGFINGQYQKQPNNCEAHLSEVLKDLGVQCNPLADITVDPLGNVLTYNERVNYAYFEVVTDDDKSINGVVIELPFTPKLH